jgi:hypothetical protein
MLSEGRSQESGQHKLGVSLRSIRVRFMATVSLFGWVNRKQSLRRSGTFFDRPMVTGEKRRVCVSSTIQQKCIERPRDAMNTNPRFE